MKNRKSTPIQIGLFCGVGGFIVACCVLGWLLARTAKVKHDYVEKYLSFAASVEVALETEKWMVAKVAIECLKESLPLSPDFNDNEARRLHQKATMALEDYKRVLEINASIEKQVETIHSDGAIAAIAEANEKLLRGEMGHVTFLRELERIENEADQESVEIERLVSTRSYALQKANKVGADFLRCYEEMIK